MHRAKVIPVVSPLDAEPPHLGGSEKKTAKCQEEDFKLRCRLFDWKDGQEDVLWKGFSGLQASGACLQNQGS